MYPAVNKVEILKPFLLKVEFDNGESGVLDMEPYLEFGIFKRLQDVQKFGEVRVAFDTIMWDDGQDLDPEFVYANCRMYASETNPYNGESGVLP